MCIDSDALPKPNCGEIGRQIPVRTRSVQKLSYCHKQILTFTFILIHPIPFHWILHGSHATPQNKDKRKKDNHSTNWLLDIFPVFHPLYLWILTPVHHLFGRYYILLLVLVKVLVQISFCTERICSWISEIHQDLLCLNCKCHNWCRSTFMSIYVVGEEAW